MSTIEIGFGSAVYYELLAARPEWGKYLALGEQVIFLVDGEAYQIISGEQGISSLPSGLSNSGNSPQEMEQVGRSGFENIRSLCSAPFLVGLVLMGAGFKFRT